jgi:peptidoglycan/xylan/chitin deacetylase (PgdA/CDA1 family)
MNRFVRGLAARLWVQKERLVSGTSRTPGVRILIFHHVRSQEEASFERLIDHLLDRDELVSPDEAFRRDPATVRYVLSFDDGFRSNHSLARRLLKPRDLRAFFFLCSGLVGQADPLPLIDRYIFPGISVPDALKRELQFMSWDEATDLAEEGHTIGSHSMLHRRLSELSDERDLHEEIVNSGEVLANRLKRAVKWFAYPFGDLQSINAIALDLISRHYDYCCTGIRGLNPPDDGSHVLFREHIDLGASFPYQLMSARGGLDVGYRRQRRALGRMISQ